MAELNLYFPPGITVNVIQGAPPDQGGASPVNCVVSDWSPWTPINATTEQRTRTIVTPAAHGGTACPTPDQLVETRPIAASSAVLLQPADFTLLRYYDVQLAGRDSTYAQCLTHRYVNGDLRFLQMQLGGVLAEFSIAGAAFGDRITTRTNTWDLASALPGGNVNTFNGLWWDAASARLFHTAAADYTANNYPAWIDTVSLNADGTISNAQTAIVGTIPWRRVYGGVQPIPARWQSAFGGHRYVCGWGGYASLLNQGGGVSLGPAMYAVPDPSGYPNNGVMPAQVVMDTSGADRRGVRVTLPVNYYDGGDPRSNPTTPPTDPPLATAQWLSPGPDGLGWMVWGDSYYNTGMWIDTPTKQGFVAVASLGGGKNWYAGSTLHSDFRQFEWHVFDPATMGQTGRPAAMGAFTVPGLGDLGGPGTTGNSPAGNLNGATFDPTTNRLYVMGCALGSDIFTNRLYVFQVAV